jgi:hypothetical protein
MILRATAVLVLVAFVAATADAQTPHASPAPEPTPAATFMPIPSPLPTQPATATPVPQASATASSGPAGLATNPTPPANLISYTGQLLDYRKNYVFFTSGDAFAAVDPLRIVTYETNQPTTVQPVAKMFAKATFDPTTHKIIELAITKKRLAVTQDTRALIGFQVEKSNQENAPELHGGPALTGKRVTVVFEVTAPPTTSLTDILYISTDASGWDPQAIRLDRIDAYKYRAQRYFASGTKFSYRVTRGTWNSVERGEDGLDPAPHQFFVREVDTLAARVTVYHWSDENPAHPQAGPQAIPTPFNSNPFGGGPGGITVPQLPTPRPTPFR